MVSPRMGIATHRPTVPLVIFMLAGDRRLDAGQHRSGALCLGQPDAAVVLASRADRVGDQRTSASLVTVEFAPGGRGTRMVFTEQVAFLDGCDERDERIEGTNEGFDRMELDLQAELMRQ